MFIRYQNSHFYVAVSWLALCFWAITLDIWTDLHLNSVLPRRANHHRGWADVFTSRQSGPWRPVHRSKAQHRGAHDERPARAEGPTAGVWSENLLKVSLPVNFLASLEIFMNICFPSWQNLQNLQPLDDCLIGQTKENKKKNRYKNIVPCKRSHKCSVLYLYSVS